MWIILKDGLFILNESKEAVLIFLITILGFGLFSAQYILGKEITLGIRFLIGFGIGSIPLSLFSYTLVVLVRIWPAIIYPGSLIIAGISILFILKTLWVQRADIVYNPNYILAGLIFIFLLFIRLAYLKNIIYPPYSDSPIHYQVIKNLINPAVDYESKLVLDNIFTTYYHFGFHSIVAWFVTLSQRDPLVVIPLLGQLFLVIAPFSMAALVYVTTANVSSAYLSGLLTTIGWLMPGFAANWGKYPALTAIISLPAFLSLCLILSKSNTRKPIFLAYITILAIAITLIHTRIVVCLALVFVCFYIINKLNIENETTFLQALTLSVFFIFSLTPVLPILKDFYKAPASATMLVLLTPFAFMFYRKLSVGSFLFLFMIGLVSNPIINIFGKNLIDRQFLSILLFIPLSFMAGLGFDGVVKKFNPLYLPTKIFAIVIFGFLLLNFPRNGAFYPNHCCNYFKQEDQAAFNWIEKNIPQKSLFIIATYNNSDKIYGTDAGIWIYPITSIPTNKLPFTSQWNTNTLADICSFGSPHIYIYAGNAEFSFKKKQLIDESLFSTVYNSESIAIYEVIGCNNEH